MYKYIEAFKVYIQAHKRSYRCPDVGSVLGMLSCCYQKHRGIDPKMVRAYYDELYETAEKVLPGTGRQVVDDATKLSKIFEKQAFQEGVIVGFQLYDALYKSLEQRELQRTE